MKKNIKTGMKLTDIMLHERNQTQRAHAVSFLFYEVQNQAQLIYADTRLIYADTRLIYADPAFLAPDHPFKPFFVRVCVCVCAQSLSWVRLCDSHGLQPTRLPCSWGFPGKNIGARYHFHLQGIFPTQGLNPYVLCLQH